MKEYDIIIIGNGVLGYSAAFSLAIKNSSLKIAILGDPSRAGAATTCAGAMLNCFAEVTYHATSKYHHEKFNIAYKSAKKWPSWKDNINQYTKKSKITLKEGTFVILNSFGTSSDEKNYQAIINTLKQYNEPYDEVIPEQIPGVCPTVKNRPLRGLFLPKEGYVNPNDLLAALEEACLNLNVDVINQKAKKLLIETHGKNEIELESSEKIKFKKILIAAGAYSQELINQMPSLRPKIPPILSGCGTSAICKLKDYELPYAIRTVNRAGSCGNHLVPYIGTDYTYFGSSNILNWNPQNHTTIGELYFLLHNTINQFNQNFIDAKIIKHFVGNRPITLDAFPLIGQTSLDQVWILTGTYREGLHDSAFLADYISDAMLNENDPSDNLFKPERKLIETMSKNDALEIFISQLNGELFEHGFKSPLLGSNYQMEDMIRKRAEDLYQLLNTDCAISPDMLLMLDDKKELIPLIKEYIS